MKKWIILALRLIVLTVCIVYLVFNVDFDYLFNNVLKKIPFWIFFVSIFLSLFKIWLNSIRWKLINTDYSYQLSNWDYFRYMMMSSSFELVMPGIIGVDVIRAFWVGSDVQSNKTRNVLSIFFDRAMGFFSIFILGLSALSFSTFFSWQFKIITWIISLLILGLIILLIWFIKRSSYENLVNRWNPGKKLSIRIKSALIVFKDVIIFYLGRPGVFIYALLLSFIIHTASFTINYLIAIFLNIEISFFDISVATCLVWFITSIPISIAGIGIREISYISILSYYGVSAEAAMGLSLYHFAIMILVGLLGLPFIFTSKKIKI